MSHTLFRVNLNTSCVNFKEHLAGKGMISKVLMIATGFEPTIISFVNEH